MSPTPAQSLIKRATIDIHLQRKYRKNLKMEDTVQFSNSFDSSPLNSIIFTRTYFDKVDHAARRATGEAGHFLSYRRRRKIPLRCRTNRTRGDICLARSYAAWNTRWCHGRRIADLQTEIWFGFTARVCREDGNNLQITSGRCFGPR